MRLIMLIILGCMIAGLLSTLVVPGSDEQVPPGASIEEPI